MSETQDPHGPQRIELIPLEPKMIHHRELRWRPHPWRWARAAGAWAGVAVAAAWWKLPHRHHHSHRPVAVYHWAAPFTQPQTVILSACWCWGPDRYRTQVIPGRFTLAQILTNPFAAAASGQVATDGGFVQAE